MKLYEIEAAINEAIEELLSSVDEETGEVDETKAQALEALKEEKEKKLENIACYIKNLKAEAAALKEEEGKLNQRRKAAENKAARLSEFIGLHISTDEKITTARAVIAFRKSKRVDVLDESAIPQKFIKTKTETSVDKVAIAHAFKEGATVPGVDYIDTYSLQIK